MVLKRIIPKKQDLPEIPEVEEFEEEQEEEVEEVKPEVKKPVMRPQLKPVKEMELRIVSKENIPYERIQIVKGEQGTEYEVLTIEEALQEILTILRSA